VNEADQITQLLATARTIAVVGLSDSPLRPSYGVAEYLQAHGYRIIPVNPALTEALGEPCYPTLTDIPASERLDVVDIFRRSEPVPAIVAAAIRRGNVGAIWMQDGIVHDEAAAKARQAGIPVIMDRCISREHRRRR